jgi:hypothetical protein
MKVKFFTEPYLLYEGGFTSIIGHRVGYIFSGKHNHMFPVFIYDKYTGVYSWWK